MSDAAIPKTNRFTLILLWLIMIAGLVCGIGAFYVYVVMPQLESSKKQGTEEKKQEQKATTPAPGSPGQPDPTATKSIPLSPLQSALSNFDWQLRDYRRVRPSDQSYQYTALDLRKHISLPMSAWGSNQSALETETRKLTKKSIKSFQGIEIAVHIGGANIWFVRVKYDDDTDEALMEPDMISDMELVELMNRISYQVLEPVVKVEDAKRIGPVK